MTPVMWAAAFTLASATALAAQTNASPTPAPVQQTLELIRQSAQRFSTTMPSLSCHETILVQTLKQGTVKKEQHFEALLRVTRNGEEKFPFTEHHRFTVVDGVPLPDNGKFKIDYWLTGGYTNALGPRTPEQILTPCNEYRLEAGSAPGVHRLISDRRPGSDGLPYCQTHSLPGLHRETSVDDAGHVVEVRRTLPPEVAHHAKDTVFAQVDYAPVSLGGETLWLPARLQSHDPKDEHRLDVRYDHCERYTASMKILDGMEKVPQPEPEPNQ